MRRALVAGGVVTLVLALAGAWLWPRTAPQAGTAGGTGAQDSLLASLLPASSPPCDQAVLARWRLVGEPDARAGRAILFSEQKGSHRVGSGAVLDGQIIVQSVRANGVSLACQEGRATRELVAPPPAGVSTVLAAPQGN